MNLEGIIVRHKKFGDGKVLKTTEKDLIVRFSVGDKRFLYPESFDSILSILDDDIAMNLKSEIDEHRMRASEMITSKSEISSVKSLLNKPIETKEHLLRISREQKSKVHEIVKTKNINSLVHFTRQENLPSILMHGLVPVKLQQELKIKSLHNDDQRIDEQLDATSLSIEFPNYSLFYKFRYSQYPNSKWVILIVDKEILFSPTHIVFFCHTNAASVLPHTPNKSELCKAKSFEDLYSDSAFTKEGKEIYRSNLHISYNLPTNPQAEVLISSIIEPQYINRIYFENVNQKDECLNSKGFEKLSEYEHLINPEFFRPRSDFKHWQKGKENGNPNLFHSPIELIFDL